MARPSDLEKMTYAELTEMEARIERLKTEKQNSERAAVRKQLMDLAKEHGFDIRELLDGRKKGKGSVLPNIAIPRIRRIPGLAAVACRAGWQPRPRAARFTRTIF